MSLRGIAFYLGCGALSLLMDAMPAIANTSASKVVDVSGISVTLNLEKLASGGTALISECVVPQPQVDVWRVLSDYDRLWEFVPFITESRISIGPGGEMLLTQKGRAGLWLLQRPFAVTFLVEETPLREIRFTALEGDFERFDGSWEIERRTEGTWIRHRVSIQPRFYVPRWIQSIAERNIMLRSLEAILQRIRTTEV